MNGLSDVEREVVSSFRQFADNEVAPGATARDATGAFPYDLVPRIAATGLFGMIFDPDDGGQAAPTTAYVLALEQIARADQSVAALVANQVGLSALPIVKFGTPAQRRRWLPPLFSGEVLGAFGLTEPEAGSDTSAISTRAARVADGWVLTGTKMFITNAGTDLTGFVIVAAVSGTRADGRPTVTSFLVETSNPGFSVGPPLKKMGWRASDTRQVVLDECRVPAGAVLGEPDRGLSQLLGALDFGRIQIATLGVGLIQAALDSSSVHARERSAFGQPIGRFQGVAFKLADMETEGSAARLLTLHAARLRDAGEPYAHEAAVAKLYASEAAMRAATQCVQVHGGAGFMEDSTASRLFRDAKILEIGEGTSEVQRLVISRRFTG